MKKIINPFYNGGTIWKAYRITGGKRWCVSWNSLLRYHDFSLSTPKPLCWFFRYVNNEYYLIIQLLGFIFIKHKINKYDNMEY